MMLKLIRTYFRVSSLIAPNRTGKRSFKLFQKVRIKDLREREYAFFEEADNFKIPFDKEDLDGYEMGDPNGKLVLLVHGWESNAGSMTRLAFKFAENGYRVVAFNLPGHAFYSSDSTNLLECYTAMIKVLDYLNPTSPFSIVSHSFGSAVTANAIARTNYDVDRMVFLTSPNKVVDIFKEFKQIIGLNAKAYKALLLKTQSILNAPLSTLDVDTNVRNAKFGELLLIHDKNDRVLSYNNSKGIESLSSDSRLFTLEDIGHYKMLWSDTVVDKTVEFVTQEKALKSA